MYAFSRQAFLFRKQQEPVTWPEGSFVRCGLPFLRNVAGFLKPTTVFIQRFGHLARKNVVELCIEDLNELCTEGEIIMDNVTQDLELPGYVIIKLQKYFIGAGLLLEGNRLLCRFSKALRQALSRITPQ